MVVMSIKACYGVMKFMNNFSGGFRMRLIWSYWENIIYCTRYFHKKKKNALLLNQCIVTIICMQDYYTN